MPIRSFCRDAPKERSAIGRRDVLVGAIAPLLARCSSDPNSKSAALSRAFVRSLNIFSVGSSVTLKEVSDTPFASIGVRIGSGRQTMLVLASRAGPSTVWTSAPHIAIEIRSGRIMRTAGLPHDLSATAASGADPLALGLQTLRDTAQAQRVLDFADRNLLGNVVVSNFSPVGPADIDVLGTPIRTVHALEQCSCATLSWNFTNEYWADVKTGLVWRSMQHIHPDLDVVEVELFRPPKARQ